jgi:hypothetical protein
MPTEQFFYRFWDVTDGERELLAMFNAAGMGDALQRAAGLLATHHDASRIEIERTGRVFETGPEWQKGNVGAC